MRTSFSIAVLVAALAAASPVADPHVRTYTRIHTNVRVVYQTVTAPASSPDPTPTPSPDLRDVFGNVRIVRAGRRSRVTITRTITPTPDPTPEVVQVADDSDDDSDDAPVVQVQPTSTPEPSPTPSPEPVPEPVREEAPAPAPAPVQEPEQSPAQAPSTGNTYKDAVLTSHNEGRAKHGVAPLEWDDELESIAQETADKCVYQHEMKVQGGGYGQNIAAGGDAASITNVITDQFYSEVKYYQWYGAEPSMANFELWGHFSQIVWKDTTKVACVTKDCSAQGLTHPTAPGGRRDDVPPHFTVCNYRKVGNVAGGYAKNVLAPVS